MATQWLTPTKAAEYIGCSIHEIYRAAEGGTLVAYVKPWSNKAAILTSTDDLDRWIQSWPSAEGVKS